MTDLRKTSGRQQISEPKSSPPAAFYLLASIAVLFLAASAAPTPLYATYQARWGFSPITTTVVFGIYAIAVLSALLIFGALSDHVGRRPILLVGITGQAISMFLFATVSSVPELMVARLIQGLATGTAIGAVGAGLIDLHRVKGTVANAVGPIAGTATGALSSGFLVQFLPYPTHLVYFLFLAVFVAQGIGVLLIAEPSGKKPGAIASLRPSLAVPSVARKPFYIAIPLLISLWAIGGFYASLGPTVTRLIVGTQSDIIGALPIFVLMGAGALTVLVMHQTKARTLIHLGALSLFVGTLITLIAIVETSVPVFFVGAAITGVGFGTAFQGAIRTVLPLAPATERAGLLSMIYVVSYLALGVPAIVAGFLVVHGGGVMTTAKEFSAAVMVLVGLAIVGLIRSHQRESSYEIATIPVATELTSKAS